MADKYLPIKSGDGIRALKHVEVVTDSLSVAALNEQYRDCVSIRAIIPGTAATNLGKAEDAAHASGDTGVMVLGVRKDTAAQLAGADSDYTPAIYDASGRLWVNADRAIIQAGSSGGYDSYRNLNLGTTGQVVKSSAGSFYFIDIFNAAGAVRYVKVYDKATAATDADTPKMTIPVGAGLSRTIEIPAAGAAFSAGIGLRATTGLADNDTGAPSANDVIVNVLFK